MAALQREVESRAAWYYEELADAFTERSLALGDAGLRRLARQLAATVEAIGRHQPES